MRSNSIYQKIIMQPVNVHEIDSENSSIFDSDNFREVDSDEDLSIDDLSLIPNQ